MTDRQGERADARAADEPLPEIGSKWVSRDPRDKGLIVTVTGVSGRYIQIKRFNKSLIRRDRFHKAYRSVADV